MNQRGKKVLAGDGKGFKLWVHLNYSNENDFTSLNRLNVNEKLGSLMSWLFIRRVTRFTGKRIKFQKFMNIIKIKT